MTYEDFLSHAKKYRLLFKYTYEVGDWRDIFVISSAFVGVVGFAVTYCIMIWLDGLVGVVFGLSLALLVGLCVGHLYTKFSCRRVFERLLKVGIVSSSDKSLPMWELKKRYLTSKVLPDIGDVGEFLDRVKGVEEKILSSREALENVFGFGLLEELFSLKVRGGAIYSLSIGALGAIVALYVSEIKSGLEEFYGSVFNYFLFCGLLLSAAILIAVLVSMLLGVLGGVVIRYLDKKDLHLSKYARHQFKYDLLIYARVM